jgi:type I restriction-modification system DNA methylase subunit
MLPLTVLRRFDAVLALSKDAVLKRYAELSSQGHPNIDAILNNLAKDEDGKPLGFHNHSQLDFHKLKGDPDNIGRHLADYINGFSENIRKIFERFEFEKEIEKARRIQPPLSGRRPVCRDRPASAQGRQHHHGAGVRGPDPPLQRSRQRNGR